MRTFISVQRMPSWMLLLLFVSAVVPILIIFGVGYDEYTLYRDTGEISPELEEMLQALVIILITYVSIYFVLFLPPLKVRINHEGIHYFCFPYLRKGKSITWKEIKNVEIVQVNPLGDFGGWGYRATWKGNRGYILKGGPAIKIERKASDKTMTLTINQAEQAQRVLNHYLQKQEAQ